MLKTKYLALIMNGEKSSITDIDQLHSLTASSEEEDANAFVEFKLGFDCGWIEITEEEHKEASHLLSSVTTAAIKGELAKIDVYISRYKEEKDLMDMGKLDATYRTEEEYIELLEERIELRKKFDIVKARSKAKTDWIAQFDKY